MGLGRVRQVPGFMPEGQTEARLPVIHSPRGWGRVMYDRDRTGQSKKRPRRWSAGVRPLARRPDRRLLLIVVILGLVPTLNRTAVPPPGSDGGDGTGERHGTEDAVSVKAVRCRSPRPTIGWHRSGDAA